MPNREGSAIHDTSFTNKLLDKLAGVQIGNPDINTKALQKEAKRQITQSLKGEDPINGAGVTKSGEED